MPTGINSAESLQSCTQAYQQYEASLIHFLLNAEANGSNHYRASQSSNAQNFCRRTRSFTSCAISSSRIDSEEVKSSSDAGSRDFKALLDLRYRTFLSFKKLPIGVAEIVNF